MSQPALFTYREENPEVGAQAVGAEYLILRGGDGLYAHISQVTRSYMSQRVTFTRI